MMKKVQEIYRDIPLDKIYLVKKNPREFSSIKHIFCIPVLSAKISVWLDEHFKRVIDARVERAD